MEEGDRPFIIQQFMSTSTSEGGVIVVGAHFPHPTTLGSTDFKETENLRIALAGVLNQTEIERVLLMADTNEGTSVKSEQLMEHLLGSRGGEIVSSSLERTCCWDNDFAWWGVFDRIIANFGAEMQTEVLFDPLPSWAKEIQNESDPGSKRGAFHKAIKVSLLMEGPKAKRRIGLITLTIVLAVGVGLLCGLLVCCFLAKRRDVSRNCWAPDTSCAHA